MAALTAIMDALAAQIRTQLDGDVANLTVYERMSFNPTPPFVDVYPSEEFQDALAFGKGNNSINLTVRMRVSTAEHEGAQDLLLSVMDPEAGTSMAQAIMSDRTLGGVVERIRVAGPTAFGVFPSASGSSDGSLLGCTWQVLVIP